MKARTNAFRRAATAVVTPLAATGTTVTAVFAVSTARAATAEAATCSYRAHAKSTALDSVPFGYYTVSEVYEDYGWNTDSGDRWRCNDEIHGLSRHSDGCYAAFDVVQGPCEGFSTPLNYKGAAPAEFDTTGDFSAETSPGAGDWAYWDNYVYLKFKADGEFGSDCTGGPIPNNQVDVLHCNTGYGGL